MQQVKQPAPFFGEISRQTRMETKQLKTGDRHELTYIMGVTKCKGAKIRNRYNQVPHLTQDTNGKVTTSQLDTTNELSQQVTTKHI